MGPPEGQPRFSRRGEREGLPWPSRSSWWHTSAFTHMKPARPTALITATERLTATLVAVPEPIEGLARFFHEMLVKGRRRVVAHDEAPVVVTRDILPA
jgi:hypothetical protein